MFSGASIFSIEAIFGSLIYNVVGGNREGGRKWRNSAAQRRTVSHGVADGVITPMSEQWNILRPIR